MALYVAVSANVCTAVALGPRRRPDQTSHCVVQNS